MIPFIHENCDGQIIYASMREGFVHFLCVKCGRVGDGLLSDRATLMIALSKGTPLLVKLINEK